MFTQLKATIVGAILLVALILAGLIYWRASSNVTTKNDLRIARETIKVEREALKITHAIDMRVNAESIQTANKAQEAASEIDAIRVARDAAQREGTGPVPPVRSQAGEVVGPGPDADAARVLQLAREARAAAVASSARLQPANAGTR